MMPARVEPRDFDKKKSYKTARELRVRLGPLAIFVLNDDTLQLIKESTIRPKLSSHSGCCWPVLAILKDNWLQYLLDAIVLPLQWRNAKRHDDLLPKDVIKCADKVKEAFSAPSDIYLCFEPAGMPNLSNFDSESLTAGSCFSALALGLQSFLDKIAPDPKVWSSACWQRNPKKVDHLEKKLGTASLFGATHFFVAPDQECGSTNTSARIKIKKLESVPNDGLARKSFAKLFSFAYVKPVGGTWEDCRRYHAVLRDYDKDKAKEYYCSDLIKHLTKRLREQLPARGANTALPTHLVTIATRRSEAIALIASTLKIPKALVLYTVGSGDLEAEARKTENEIRKMHPTCDVILEEFRYDPTSEDFPNDFAIGMIEAIKRFQGDAPNEKMVFDIDRGTTMHKIALLKRVIHDDSFLVTINHEMDSKGVDINHGTEKILMDCYAKFFPK